MPRSAKAHAHDPHDAGTSLTPLPNRVAKSFHDAMLAHRLLMSRKLTECGLHPGQAMCLREVAHDEGISQRDLADRLNVTRPVVTVMLQKMERAGLVERRADESDQRFMRIYLTEKSRRIHENAHATLREVAASMVDGIAEEDQERLVALLGRMSENMHAAAAEDTPAAGYTGSDAGTDTEEGTTR